MKILEVKNNLVKISYTAQDDLVISGFVIIEDSQYPYVAQVMSLKADGGINYAIVKLLFTFNEEGVVKNYNGSVPELDANVTRLSADELLDILPIEHPLKLGKLSQQKFILNVDYSTLEKNLLVCSDYLENTDILISNFAKQITDNNDKSIIFDTTGTINAENRLIFGKDFKLPLNYDTINFIYEHDLNDIDATSKAILQDILLEIQEYSKTVLDKFIPFDSFINVVDMQYKQLRLPELALLKNRLIKYKEENAFAQDAKDVQAFRASVRANLSTLIDISDTDEVLQNLVMHTLYNELYDLDLFIYSFVKVNNDNADKKLLKKFLAQDKVYTTVICSHNFRYLYELKEIAGNLILFTPQTTQHDFNSYNVFLNKLNPDEYIVYGKSTQNVPLIIENLTLEDLNEYEQEFNTDANKDSSGEVLDNENSFDNESNSYSEEDMTEDTPIQEDFGTDEADENYEYDAADEIENADPLLDVTLDNTEENIEDNIVSEDNQAEESSFDEYGVEPLPEEVADDAEQEPALEEEYTDIPESDDNYMQPLDETAEEEPQEFDSQINDVDEFTDNDQYITDNYDEVAAAETDSTVTDNAAEQLTEDDLDFIGNISETDSQEEFAETVSPEEDLPDFAEDNTETPGDTTFDFGEYEQDEASNVNNTDNEVLEFDDTQTQSEETADLSIIEDTSSDESAGLEVLDEIQESADNKVEPKEVLQETSNDDENIPLAGDMLDFMETNEVSSDSPEVISDESLDVLPDDTQSQDVELPFEENEDSDALLDELDSGYDFQNSGVPDDENPTVVPIYPVEEETPVAGVPQTFDAGDRVRHPKYGDGIVEKMVKFGNKVLCAISFANGRRLLDPTISQLEKI